MKNLYEASRRGILTLIAAVGLVLIAASMPALADEITDANVADKVASASTAADHLAIAAYYRGLASASEEKIKLHQKMRASIASGKGKPAASWAHHCDTLIEGYRSTKQAAESMAQEQESLAKSAGK